MDHSKIVKDLINQMPLPKYILETFPFSWVFGGFMRWIITFIEENKRSPTLEEVQKKLFKNDMDIRIRSNNNYKEWSSNQIISQIFTKARELGGKIEYMGHQYQDIILDKEDKNFYFKNPNYFYSGNYSVWLPINKEEWNRYDISIFSEDGVGYMTDYAVNNIQFSLKDGLTHLDNLLPYIRNKIMTIINIDAKTIYRGAKLWNEGYILLDEDKKMIREYLDELKKKKWFRDQ